MRDDLFDKGREEVQAESENKAVKEARETEGEELTIIERE